MEKSLPGGRSIPCSASSRAKAEERGTAPPAGSFKKAPGAAWSAWTRDHLGLLWQRLRGDFLILSLSCSLESPAAFSRYEALIGHIFPSGGAQPSSFLVSCLQSYPWNAGHVPLLLLPAAAAKTIVANTLKSAPYRFS